MAQRVVKTEFSPQNTCKKTKNRCGIHSSDSSTGDVETADPRDSVSGQPNLLVEFQTSEKYFPKNKKGEQGPERWFSG